MSLVVVKANSSRRFLEVRNLCSFISTLESHDPRIPDADDVKALRGLFFVNLYAAWEYSLTNAVTAVLNEINSSGLVYSDLNSSTYVFALEAQFESLKALGAKRKWEGRLSLFEKQFSSDRLALVDTVFSKDLQNSWAKVVEQVFKCLGVSESAFLSTSLALRVDSLVDKRNAVAHGRLSPIDASMGLRSADLMDYFNDVNNAFLHIFECLERYCKNRDYER